MRDRYPLVVVNELLLFLAPRKKQHCFDCCDAPSTAWRVTSVAMQPLWPLALM